jgi:hypothetical protein
MQKPVSCDDTSDEARKGDPPDGFLAGFGDGSKSSGPLSQLVMDGAGTVTSILPFPMIGPGSRPEIFGFMRAVQFIEQFFPDAAEKNVFRGGVCQIIFRCKVNLVRYSACILYMFTFLGFSAVTFLSSHLRPGMDLLGNLCLTFSHIDFVTTAFIRLV